MTLPCHHFYISFLKFGILLMFIVFFCYLIPKITQNHFPMEVNKILNTKVKSIERKRNSEGSVNYPWIRDETCKNFSVKFANINTYPKWPLTSFPGSGVTWTRQLIEGVTGIYTGTVYPNETQILDGNHHGNEAHPDCLCTIVIKDHGHPDAPFIGSEGEYENRGILLLRNPFDALFSYAHYLWSDRNQIGIVSPNEFIGKTWDDYVKNVANEWAGHADRWIKYIQNGTVIFYEILMQDTETELKRLLQAINFIDLHHPPMDLKRMRCTLKHKNRIDRKRPNKPRTPLTYKQNSKLMESIGKVQESLLKKGWPLLPLHLYNLESVQKL